MALKVQSPRPLWSQQTADVYTCSNKSIVTRVAMHNGLKPNAKHQIVDVKDVVTTAEMLALEDALTAITTEEEDNVAIYDSTKNLITVWVVN